ncbi:hypothetical protein [Deefgea salmonis]|uniref:Uncharacterized protein n=1 Tax=Deefgea salmonis TaxID=2875502 RepID=A0ABS8BMC9_9NEIS|nr:hypothetical protein [Deefgea salmonis]MCB5196893.1 hypothetical protein [Deefgea salmonis]
MDSQRARILFCSKQRHCFHRRKAKVFRCQQLVSELALLGVAVFAPQWTVGTAYLHCDAGDLAALRVAIEMLIRDVVIQDAVIRASMPKVRQRINNEYPSIIC